jgi:hypothetical protein
MRVDESGVIRQYIVGRDVVVVRESGAGSRTRGGYTLDLVGERPADHVDLLSGEQLAETDHAFASVRFWRGLRVDDEVGEDHGVGSGGWLARMCVGDVKVEEVNGDGLPSPGHQ